MHAKFEVAGFLNKRDICHRSHDFVSLFLLKHLLVQVTWWFLASDAIEIQTSVEEYLELDPFLYIWYHTVRTHYGLSPCV